MRTALFGIAHIKIETYIFSKKITSLFRVFITDSWLRNVYLIYSLSRGTVVILFLGNICLYFFTYDYVGQPPRWFTKGIPLLDAFLAYVF